MSGFSATVPPVVTDYQRSHPMAWAINWHHPTIVEEFHPQRGWQRPGFKKRISPSWAAKRRRAGITHMALDIGAGIVADFSTVGLSRRTPKGTRQ